MRKSLNALVLSILILSLATAAMAADDAGGASSAPVPGVVNINTADATQLSYLPRVGAKAAERIIAYREEHGPFKKTTDLMQVKGFGQKTFDRLSAYVVVEGKTTLSEKISSPRKARGSRKQPASTATK